MFNTSALTATSAVGFDSDTPLVEALHRQITCELDHAQRVASSLETGNYNSHDDHQICKINGYAQALKNTLTFLAEIVKVRHAPIGAFSCGRRTLDPVAGLRETRRLTCHLVVGHPGDHQDFIAPRGRQFFSEAVSEPGTPTDRRLCPVCNTAYPCASVAPYL